MTVCYVRSPALAASHLTAQDIGRAATLALHDELCLSPKPGLVTLTDRGSHADMDAQTFMRSLLALRGYFVRIAELGAAGSSFEELERCGIAAEARMMAATGGINTHRGAIFMLGLLCAAAGALGRRVAPAELRQTLLACWGCDLSARATRASTLPGGMAARRFKLRSASEEAAMGFPTLFETAAPSLHGGLTRGLTPTQARLDALFTVISTLDDSNLAHRGGLEGLRWAQAAAHRFLDTGGAGAAHGLDNAASIGNEFVSRHLSPGGSADTLAAACLLSRIA